MFSDVIHNDINDRKGRHSRESGNPGKDWIPSQARNDKLERTYVVMYKHLTLYALRFTVIGEQLKGEGRSGFGMGK